jgi:hypothetical protein
LKGQTFWQEAHAKAHVYVQKLAVMRCSKEFTFGAQRRIECPLMPSDADFDLWVLGNLGIRAADPRTRLGKLIIHHLSLHLSLPM